VYIEVRTDTFTTLSNPVSTATRFTPLMSQTLTVGCVYLNSYGLFDLFCIIHFFGSFYCSVSFNLIGVCLHF
jgi:hypothetical protein